jgi:hypothetical protein
MLVLFDALTTWKIHVSDCASLLDIQNTKEGIERPAIII